MSDEQRQQYFDAVTKNGFLSEKKLGLIDCLREDKTMLSQLLLTFCPDFIFEIENATIGELDLYCRRFLKVYKDKITLSYRLDSLENAFYQEGANYEVVDDYTKCSLSIDNYYNNLFQKNYKVNL